MFNEIKTNTCNLCSVDSMLSMNVRGNKFCLQKLHREVYLNGGLNKEGKKKHMQI